MKFLHRKIYCRSPKNEWKGSHNKNRVIKLCTDAVVFSLTFERAAVRAQNMNQISTLLHWLPWFKSCCQSEIEQWLSLTATVLGTPLRRRINTTTLCLLGYTCVETEARKLQFLAPWLSPERLVQGRSAWCSDVSNRTSSPRLACPSLCPCPCTYLFPCPWPCPSRREHPMSIGNGTLAQEPASWSARCEPPHAQAGRSRGVRHAGQGEFSEHRPWCPSVPEQPSRSRWRPHQTARSTCEVAPRTCQRLYAGLQGIHSGGALAATHTVVLRSSARTRPAVAAKPLHPQCRLRAPTAFAQPSWHAMISM